MRPGGEVRGRGLRGCAGRGAEVHAPSACYTRSPAPAGVIVQGVMAGGLGLGTEVREEWRDNLRGSNIYIVSQINNGYYKKNNN